MAIIDVKLHSFITSTPVYCLYLFTSRELSPGIHHEIVYSLSKGGRSHYSLYIVGLSVDAMVQHRSNRRGENKGSLGAY
jgi:hypothetical protein